MNTEAFRNLAGPLQALAKTVEELFSLLVSACRESLIAIADMFREVRKKIEVEDSSPRAYGKSLLNGSRHKNQTLSVHYDYMPVALKHLPYQRRAN